MTPCAGPTCPPTPPYTTPPSAPASPPRSRASPRAPGDPTAGIDRQRAGHALAQQRRGGVHAGVAPTLVATPLQPAAANGRRALAGAIPAAHGRHPPALDATAGAA